MFISFLLIIVIIEHNKSSIPCGSSHDSKTTHGMHSLNLFSFSHLFFFFLHFLLSPFLFLCQKDNLEKSYPTLTKVGTTNMFQWKLFHLCIKKKKTFQKSSGALSHCIRCYILLCYRFCIMWHESFSWPFLSYIGLKNCFSYLPKFGL